MNGISESLERSAQRVLWMSDWSDYYNTLLKVFSPLRHMCNKSSVIYDFYLNQLFACVKSGKNGSSRKLDPTVRLKKAISNYITSK